MPSPKAAEALNTAIKLLSRLNDDERETVLTSLATFFNVRSSSIAIRAPALSSDTPSRPSFSQTQEPSPKEFLLRKQPKTDVERIVCLAYYLTQYRQTSHFRTLDLAKLNTEAAQPKFSNSAYSASNATKMGYLAPASKGQRQISAAGEQFVLALPDREAARAAMQGARPRRKRRGK